MTKNSILAGCLSALLSCSLSAHSVAAQDVGDLVLGLIGSAIQAERQNQARQQANQRANQARRQQAKCSSCDGTTHPNWAESVGVSITWRLMVLLARETRNGIRAYLQAFNLANFEFTTSDIELLESIAASGFRSANERNQALRGGFNAREDFICSTSGWLCQLSRVHQWSKRWSP